MLPTPRSLLRGIAAACCALAAAVSVAGAQVSIGSKPVLIVYPFQVGPGLAATAGNDFAVKMGESVARTGGITVSPNPVGVAQQDFLTNAKVANADYYLTGYISPIGGTVTVIEQLVSVRTGTIVWSNSAQVLTQADMDAQADQLHTVLVAYASRGYFSLGLRGAATPEPTKTDRPRGFVSANTPDTGPAPTRPPAPLPIPRDIQASAPPGSPRGAVAIAGNTGFGDDPSTFGVTAAPPPKIYASALHPSRFAVLKFTGLNERLREDTANAMILALGKRGQTAALGDPDTTDFPLLRGADICASTGANYLVWGAITATGVTEQNNFGTLYTASIRAQAWDCKGAGFVRNTKSAEARSYHLQSAIDDAADAAVRDYLMHLPGASTARS
jgi:TolB-like protein